MSHQISGEFTVKLSPQPLKGSEGETTLGLMTIDKQFSGDMVGSSWGHMLSARGKQGGAGYVAQERLEVRLAGREGGFVLQHSGFMSPEGQSLDISVVPGSGTEELLGISGTMTLRIDNGRHFYTFEYSLPNEAEA
ncbi:DUF3224 domain-containing protein [Acanthopleuribacter pedis]|uniref:DUF3224 domain-containing protein n=1 Tax=Acanthopleuribacter pedis TaxID=442870 RepID=A0A8J7U2D4_9BACT|nr:DUF3224 domain-containing protein [Acanthopleuribacter pedis]MBO1318482.1 DUF3224 domain-containing protein [Acanthopleuribacter pedis]